VTYLVVNKSLATLEGSCSSSIYGGNRVYIQATTKYFPTFYSIEKDKIKIPRTGTNRIMKG